MAGMAATPIGLPLTAVGALKFGFGALTDTFWATLRITGDRFGMEISRFGLLFALVWRHDLRKIRQHSA